MKKLLFLLLLTLPAGLRAQEYRQKFVSPQNRRVVLDMRGADVVVEGYDGDELVIRGTGRYEPPSTLANGLRPLYSAGTDNTRLGLVVRAEADNTIRISHAPNAEDRYTVRVPRRTDVSFAQNGWGGSDDVTVRDLTGRLEVRLNSGDIRLTGVSGPVVLNTVSGDIRVQFAAVPTQPCAITSVSGDVDVSLPGSAKLTFSMRSISGEIYTDFDLNLGGAAGLRHVGGQTVEGHSNGGGNSFSLKTVSGDIFLRKAR